MDMIDRHFWDIEFRDHPNDCYKQIRFTSMVGKESDWFWSEYKMGFSLANNDNDYTTGLVSKYTQTIYWGKFSGNDLYESQCLGALHINFGHFKPTIAFAFNPNTSDENVVCFVDQKRQKSGTFCEANRLKQLIDCTESDDRFGPIAYHHWLKTSQPRLFSAIKLSLVIILF
ncbi:unnamed protein product [Medioppia subpectinata]|uniref:Uncharacterized protein n=1 Tax=Medioppia subpectinata TaxID=1979941 RepID=A0A7R9PVU6_9ACAR|nr:unnamed protein product [Medioppia subpectinata]CAG2102648.1 unnamed protein product [Medioppia subpectinata]